ncbi:hypothetical protein [Halalkalibacter akibai]|uniref:Uncharacterized protein n=1 Tax=Halalkalibacter akibai (strain ATCC 43226 / DSM 21942 / CIP 109018 / JCM 9157 / 1139) TaxID=1236973 RepID=W4QY41_HALA3|nr:hypothetical protein [Halalkalibacter akibai]GAE36832.1 hypothetical protein JCM9157_4053 [Halalkalibacter akibai JCM 9157]
MGKPVKQYMVDTNAIRHRANKDKTYKIPSKAAWRNIISEVGNGEAVVFVPAN